MSLTARLTNSRTLLAPLTTTFTAPDSCSTFNVGRDEKSLFAGQVCGTNAEYASKGWSGSVMGLDTTACWPSASIAPPPNDNPLQGYGFYSPGIYCPKGYETACGAAMTGIENIVTSVGDLPSFSFQFPLIAGETAYGCCPSGMTCGYAINFPAQSCVMSTATVKTVVGTCVDAGQSSIVTSLTNAFFLAPMIQINRRAIDVGNVDPSTTSARTTDVPLPVTAENSSSAQSTNRSSRNTQSNPNTISTSSMSISATATSTSSSGSSISSSASDHDITSQGLPSSTALGMGIGVGLGGALILAALIVLLLRYRSRRNRIYRDHHSWSKEPGVATTSEPGVAVDDFRIISKKHRFNG